MDEVEKDPRAKEVLNVVARRHPLLGLQFTSSAVKETRSDAATTALWIEAADKLIGERHRAALGQSSSPEPKDEDFP